MDTLTILQRQNPDVPQGFHHLSDLAFDEDCELFLHLGLLGFLAAVIWFMNTRWRWQEIFRMLGDPLSVVVEGG
ncbi:hypothetical protein BGW80DRAFT_1463797 [Lactifluus volemus]|nr:hypothetical protein BGW80DRAFT_1463797 [Lactifluus volemus]